MTDRRRGGISKTDIRRDGLGTAAITPPSGGTVVNVYLRKLTATNDVFLNDPTKYAVARPQQPSIFQPGGGEWREEMEKIRRRRQEVEEFMTILPLILAAIEEDECQISRVA